MKFKLVTLLTLLFAAAAVAPAQRPRLGIQKGHSSSVQCLAFNRGGTVLASGAANGVIILWNPATGFELRTLEGHRDDVISVAFSPDGKTLASGGADNTARLWDVATGRELFVFDKHTDSVNAVSFSGDGKILATAAGRRLETSGDTEEDTIRLWEVATGRELHTIHAHKGRGVSAMSFSPDGKVVASAGYDNAVRLWDAGSGRRLWEFPTKSGIILSLAFSPDGKTLAADLGVEVVLLAVAGGERQKTLPMSSGWWSGKNISFGPGGRTLAGVGDDAIVIWDVGSGEPEIIGDMGWITTVALSPDGVTLAGTNFDTIILRDLKAGAVVKALGGRAHSYKRLSFTADHRTLVTSSILLSRQLQPGESLLKMWDVVNGQAPRPAPFVDGLPSPDGLLAGAGGEGRLITIGNAVTGAILRKVESSSTQATPVAFSEDGRRLAVLASCLPTPTPEPDASPEESDCDKHLVEVWDARRGQKPLASFRAAEQVDYATFSPDGKVVASGAGSELTLWEVATRRRLRTLEFHGYAPVKNIAFSGDGRMVAAGTFRSVSVWEVQTGRLLRRIELPANSYTIAFSHDGRLLACGADNGITLAEVEGDAPPRPLAGHAGRVSSVAFSRDSKILASAGFDQTVKLWDVETGRELASLLTLGRRDWMVVTPEGLFDGSPGAWRQIFWRFSERLEDVLPVEAFFNEFFRPGLFSELLAGGRPLPPAGVELGQLDRRQPSLEVDFPDVGDGAGFDGREVKVRVRVAPAPPDERRAAPGGARDVRLFRNGMLVHLWGGDVLAEGGACSRPPGAGGAAVCEATVTTVAGENVFSAYAFNGDNVKSADVSRTLTVDGEARRGTLYVLAVGVNRYADSEYNLRFAARDARAFGAEVKRRQLYLLKGGGDFARVSLVTLLDAQATRENILDALARLGGRAKPHPAAPAQLFSLSKAEPEDAVIIYYAGHGAADAERFYLLPHNLGSKRVEPGEDEWRAAVGQGISDETLSDALESIDVGQLVLVIDACQSGRWLEVGERRRGPLNAKGLAQLAYEKGMYVLTASQGFQAAVEVSRLGHGLLTYALIKEGLAGLKADAGPPDGTVLVSEWLDYAAARVPRVRAGARRSSRAVRRNRREARAPEVVAQLPRVYYRSDVEARLLVIAGRQTRPPAGDAPKK